MSEHLGELTQQVAQQDETILQLRAAATTSNQHQQHGARGNKAEARTNAAAASHAQRADASKAAEKKKASIF